MTTMYKGCKIEVTKEPCMGGYPMLFYCIYDGDYEISSGFSETEDTVREYTQGLKLVVDDYRERPEEYDM